ncbi:hypothetical protein [Actinomadura sp. NTSP31]|uniref:hypothetical protein n=1 Tax=Actinomadura sp. NTSP31 TaxID=1735447 RepID=UPI0035C1C452
MSQGKVSETMKKGGRQVTTLEVFERIADGLQMPDPARMTWAWPRAPSPRPARRPPPTRRSSHHGMPPRTWFRRIPGFPGRRSRRRGRGPRAPQNLRQARRSQRVQRHPRRPTRR